MEAAPFGKKLFELLRPARLPGIDNETVGAAFDVEAGVFEEEAAEGLVEEGTKAGVVIGGEGEGAGEFWVVVEGDGSVAELVEDGEEGSLGGEGEGGQGMTGKDEGDDGDPLGACGGRGGILVRIVEEMGGGAVVRAGEEVDGAALSALVEEGHVGKSGVPLPFGFGLVGEAVGGGEGLAAAAVAQTAPHGEEHEPDKEADQEGEKTDDAEDRRRSRPGGKECSHGESRCVLGNSQVSGKAYNQAKDE